MLTRLATVSMGFHEILTYIRTRLAAMQNIGSTAYVALYHYTLMLYGQFGGSL